MISFLSLLNVNSLELTLLETERVDLDTPFSFVSRGAKVHSRGLFMCRVLDAKKIEGEA
jgi:hypothetical protein